ncbi:hypothetical protein M2271_006695 [Streptomyces sp. LBL]|uniref:hypothetical protein n=1 Tax=Streptomyces sp. LBL TaxID=2940562 RepID=UPI002474AFF8|nr:hypothetical protein [Streptomyces sp. LBL]MDH6628860.1 hypothetical protein [Streptomyces sp. LBL]
MPGTPFRAAALAGGQSRGPRPRPLAFLGHRALSRQLDESTTFKALYDSSAAMWPPQLRYAAGTLWSDADLLTLLRELADVVDSAPFE